MSNAPSPTVVGGCDCNSPPHPPIHFNWSIAPCDVLSSDQMPCLPASFAFYQCDWLGVLQQHEHTLLHHKPSARPAHAPSAVQQQAAAAAAAAAARAEEEQKAVRPQRRAPARPVRTRAVSPSSDSEEFEYDSPYARYKGMQPECSAMSLTA